MSSVDIEKIMETTKELDRLRKEQEEVLSDINKMHKKLHSNPDLVEKPGDSSLAKLKSLYILAKELSESEVTYSNMLVNQLDALLPPGPPGQQRKKTGNEPKRKKMKTDSDISRFTPSMRNLEACASLKGEQVAARVSVDDAGKDVWFVVKVIQFDKDTKEFDVLDEEPGDDEESNGQRIIPQKYTVPMSYIIPFPKKNDPSSVQEFPPGRHVLAVYPGTTALYKATVVNTPRKRKTDDYLLEFEDDEEDGAMPQREVPFHKVVSLPEGHHRK